MKKRAISIVLALLLLLSLALTGCGDKAGSKEKDDESDNKVESVDKDRDDEDKDKDKDDEDKKPAKKEMADDEKIIGDWNLEIEMADMINEQFETQDLGDYLNVSSYPVHLTFTFEEDGTFSCVPDEKAFSRATDDVLDELKDDMVDYFEDTIAAQGVDMTVDELFESMGTTLDEMMDESIDKDELLDSIAELNLAGDYTIEDGEMTLTSNGVEEVYTYSFEDDDTFVLEDLLGDSGNETFEAMLPLTLTRD